MAGLAGIEDYRARYGDPADAGMVSALLDDTTSFFQRESGLHLLYVEDDVVTLDVPLHRAKSLDLPEVPVVSVASVVIYGQAIDPAAYRVRRWGTIDARRWRTWPYDEDIVVTYTHGYAEMPTWIVGLACSTVQRAVRPSAIAGVQGVTAGSQNVQYASSITGVNLWLTRDEMARLRGIRGPLVG